MTLKDKTDEEVIEAVKTSNTFQEALRKLIGVNKTYNGAKNKWLRKKIRELNIDISHMTHVSKGSYNRVTDEMLSEVFSLNSKYPQSNRRRLVISRNLIPYKCAICGNEGEWMGKPLALTLDHINGNNLDNRLENLRFVCPNCDRQLDTFGSKNKVRYNESVIKHEKNYCIVCGKEISKGCKMCSECYNKEQSKHVPTKEDLIKELKNFTSFIQIGKKYNVSDNAVRKWCKKYGLPFRSREIKSLMKLIVD